MFGGLGIPELLLILLIVLLLFGATRLPGVARALGRSMKEFKKGADEEEKKDGDEDKKSQD